MKTTVLLALILLPFLASAEDFHETRYLSISAAGIDLLTVKCGAGYLELQGVAGLDRINVSAQIEVADIAEADRRSFVNKKLRLKLERRGNRAVLQSEIERSATLEKQAKIDLTIDVPKKFNVTINDGSGTIAVHDLIGRLVIDDESGSIKIEKIMGEVNVDDGSGSIDIDNINGSVNVNDGSGNIDIDLVKGDVKVKDGSGGMTIQDIDGNVTVSDGSGSIEINDVQKNVFIREAGTGELNIDGVKGKVTMRD
jgi:DUF4097 and DUF4098 domain-containing protein YvlB